MTINAFYPANTSDSPAQFGNVYNGPVVTTGFKYNGAQSPEANVYSGVYQGSLSSLGNMVAMNLNPGMFKFINTVNGETVTPAGGYIYNPYTGLMDNPVWSQEQLTQKGGFNPNIAPYMTGYFREYFRDPTQCTFGNTSPIPAITGVMPSKFTDLQGNFVYYVDLQLGRLTGSNNFNNYYFVNSFNNCLAWVLTTNNFLAGLNNSQSNNLAYYGAKTYTDFISVGFDAYKQGRALRAGLRNIGYLVDTLTSGYFGTPNAVVKTMIDAGLGFVNDLSVKLLSAGVIYDEIFNPNYTPTITALLRDITNIADLAIIQDTLKTRVNPMRTPLDYLNITKCAGFENDSFYADWYAFGQDFVKRAPNYSATTGAALADLINKIQVESYANVEALASSTSLLPPDVISSLRTYLPENPLNLPVSMLNVIGTSSGYYTEQIAQVNDGISRLYASKYGTQLRDTLTNISRYKARIALSQAEIDAAATYTPTPPKQTTTVPVYGDGTTFYLTTPIEGTGGPDWWQVNLQNEITNYNNLLAQIVNDSTGDIQDIVSQINDNYDQACTYLYYEIKNFNRANFTITEFGDNNSILGFVNGLPAMGVDPQNVGTDYMLYAMTTDTVAGEAAKSVLGQSKNSDSLNGNGVSITTQV